MFYLSKVQENATGFAKGVILGLPRFASIAKQSRAQRQAYGQAHSVCLPFQ
jgi:hypothetical protein